LNKLILTIVVLLTSFSLQAEPLMTLKEMVEKTVASNPEVQLKYHEYLSSGYERDAVKGGFLPRLDAQSVYRNQESTGLGNASKSNIPTWNNELILRQMIFDGFATAEEVNRLDHAQRVRYFELQNTIQDVTLEFMTAYFDTLRYQELEGYAKRNYVIHKQLFDRIKERVDAGVARAVDLEQATGRLALAESNLLVETTNLHDVRTRIQRLMGELPPATLEQPTFFEAGLDASVVDALRATYAKNPALLSAIENIEAVRREVKTKESRYLPRVDLQARKNLHASDDGRNSVSAQDLLEVTMSYNLFNGFSDKANISRSIENLNGANDLRDKACVEARQKLIIAYNDSNQLKEQLKYRKAHQDSINKARDAYQRQFAIGQRTLLDLLDTQNEDFQAQRSVTNTNYDLKGAYARVYASQGDLLNKIGAGRRDLPEVTREAYMDSASVCQAIATQQLEIDKVALLANAEPLNLDGGTSIKPAPVPAPEKIVLSDKVVPDVQFETNSAKIKPISYPVLDNAIKTLKEWGDSNVEVAGHTDKRSTSKEEYNQLLSEKRAKAVAKYLADHGIDAKRLTAKGYGYSQPVAENDPVNGNDANRRVELIRQK
jgi:adhesin transport system outer membrane protein